MEETIDEDLLEIGFEELLGESGSIDIQHRDRAQGSHLVAADALHREHSAGAITADRLGHLDPLEFLQVLTESQEILRFAFVIKLVLNGAAKFLQDGRESIAPSDCGVFIQELSDRGQNFEVLFDLPANVRALNLDDDRTAIAQGSTMHLAE